MTGANLLQSQEDHHSVVLKLGASWARGVWGTHPPNSALVPG